MKSKRIEIEDNLPRDRIDLQKLHAQKLDLIKFTKSNNSMTSNSIKFCSEIQFSRAETIPKQSNELLMEENIANKQIEMKWREKEQKTTKQKPGPENKTLKV